jgi:hypothetical protein
MQQFLDALKEFQFLATGLFAVLAAAIGFAGVWYAQNRIARIAHEERDHREKVAREEREHREAMARRQMEEEKTDRRTSFIHAISGELSALFPMVNNAHQTTATFAFLYEQLGKGIEKEMVQPSMPFYKFNTSVYDRHVDEIGLLPPTLTHSLVSVYTRMGVTVQAVQPLPEMPKLAIGAASILARATTDAYAKLSQDIHDVVMRLHAVRLGYGDPGPGKGVEFGESCLPKTKDEIVKKDIEAADTATSIK